MRLSIAIAWKEIQAYYTNPMGYIVAMAFVAVTGFLFVLSISEEFPKASIEHLIDRSALILIVLAPAMTMRLMSEEQKLGTIELLLTSPVRDWEVVVGKFLASFVFFLGALALTLYYVILLYAFGNPDSGPIWVGYLGLVLYGAAALSVGLLASSLTNNQIVALVVGSGILLILALLGQAAEVVGGIAHTILAQMGLTSHLTDFSLGVIDSRHIIHYLSVTIVFLFLTIRAVETRRWR